MRSLNDKVVVITGAGGGIGRALAVEVAGHGARLAVSDVDAGGLAETVSLLERAGAGGVKSDVLDVSDRAAVLAYAGDVVEHFGRVNVLVNNAGVTMTGDFEEMALEEFDWLLGINLNGVVTGTKAFLPHLIASGDGHLVNISSLFGFVSMGGQSAYNASKFAVRGFTESLRQEMLVNRHPVAVTCVHPGGVRTGIVRNGRATKSQDTAAFNDIFEQKLAHTSPEKAARIIVRGILRNRARQLVGPDAHVVHFLGNILGSRYQDLLAGASRRFLPAKLS